MKVVYMGTPDFAVPPLEALKACGFDVALAVTKADRARDRGKKVQFCPVKQKAVELGIPVESPEFVKGNDELIEKLRSIAPDFIVVAAYGKILPKEILDIPAYGCVNIHASLLPKYRGAAPIHRAVIDGCKETGVTLMYMEEGLDTGDMILQRSVPVEEKTTEYLHEELAKIGAEMIVEALPKIADGSLGRTPQDSSISSYAPMVFKEEGVIDFSKTAEEICCLVRGFYSWPSASTKYNGLVMKVHKASPGKSGALDKAFGTVLGADRNGIEVACKDGSVILKNIQMPGKKAMDVSAFLLGNKIETGTVLGI